MFAEVCSTDCWFRLGDGSIESVDGPRINVSDCTLIGYPHGI